MSGFNKTVLVGNLGSDPEMRYTANGSAVSTFRIAVSRSFTTNGERREETHWFSIVTWGKLAEIVGQHLAKGRKVLVEGRLTNRDWEGPDGQKRYRTEIVADTVLFLSPTGEGGPRASLGAEDDIDPEDLPFS